MTMARPNWRAVCGNTAASIAPSRRCRCQSSGRASVNEAGEETEETVMAAGRKQEKAQEKAAPPPGDPPRKQRHTYRSSHGRGKTATPGAAGLLISLFSV